MEKEKQIEEMSRKIDEMYNVYDTTAEDIAKGLYETGYGNVKEAVKEALQKEQEKNKKARSICPSNGVYARRSPYYIARKYKEKFEYAMKELAEARKEVFMEIMEVLRFGYELPIDDIAREMAKEYGVEVCGD